QKKKKNQKQKSYTLFNARLSVWSIETSSRTQERHPSLWAPHPTKAETPCCGKRKLVTDPSIVRTQNPCFSAVMMPRQQRALSLSSKLARNYIQWLLPAVI